MEPQLQARFESLRQDETFPAELGNGEPGLIAGKFETFLQESVDGGVEESRLSARGLVTTVHALLQGIEQDDMPCNAGRIVAEISHVVFG